jgi:hypothetical protein
MTNRKYIDDCPSCKIGSLEVIYGGLPFNLGRGKDRILRCTSCEKLFMNIACEQDICHGQLPYLRIQKIETTLTDAKLSCSHCGHEYSLKTVLGNLSTLAPLLIGGTALLTTLKYLSNILGADITDL